MSFQTARQFPRWLGGALRAAYERGWSRRRLQELTREMIAEPQSDVVTAEARTIGELGDRLGRCGLHAPDVRRRAVLAGSAVLAAACSCGWLLASSPTSELMGALIGAYLAVCFIAIVAKVLQARYERSIAYCLPLVIESLILLVESGLDILPAIQQLVNAEEDGDSDPVVAILRAAYRLSSAGMIFSEALCEVADAISVREVRHVLLHLDISGAEGGELIPSLRSLGDFAYGEWKQGVEARIRRL
ncbi:MAG: type II secretion system F family protein, partial [Bdellovibrionales bacterium]|nr:type II secretion system F family protein [Bdellovibrionales bacterium]